MLGRHGTTSRRPYSIACSPEQAAESRELEFLMKTDAAGRLSTQLGSLVRGTLVDLEGPLGSFTFPDEAPETELLFIAGGTGIAPLRAMIHHALRVRHTRRVTVVYSARTPRDFAYATELRRLQRDGVLSLAMTATREAGTTWRSGRGRIDLERLKPLVPHAAATLCFICGPLALVETVPPLLGQLGIPRARIRMEEW
jgi:glycine betaine catabolism B